MWSSSNKEHICNNNQSLCGISYENIWNEYTCGILAAVLMRSSGTKQHEMKMSDFESVRPRICPDFLTSPYPRLSFKKWWHFFSPSPASIPAPPPPPHSILAIRDTDTSVQLKWEEPRDRDDVVGYYLYYSEIGQQDWHTINNKPVTGTRCKEGSITQAGERGGQEEGEWGWT